MLPKKKHINQILKLVCFKNTSTGKVVKKDLWISSTPNQIGPKMTYQEGIME